MTPGTVGTPLLAGGGFLGSFHDEASERAVFGAVRVPTKVKKLRILVIINPYKLNFDKFMIMMLPIEVSRSFSTTATTKRFDRARAL